MDQQQSILEMHAKRHIRKAFYVLLNAGFDAVVTTVDFRWKKMENLYMLIDIVVFLLIILFADLKCNQLEFPGGNTFSSIGDQLCVSHHKPPLI